MQKIVMKEENRNEGGGAVFIDSSNTLSHCACIGIRVWPTSWVRLSIAILLGKSGDVLVRVLGFNCLTELRCDIGQCAFGLYRGGDPSPFIEVGVTAALAGSHGSAVPPR